MERIEANNANDAREARFADIENRLRDLLVQALGGDAQAYHGFLKALSVTPPDGCAVLLARAVMEEPAALIRDGGVIATGLDAELDELSGAAYPATHPHYDGI